MTPVEFVKKVIRRLRYEAARPVGYALQYIVRFFNIQFLGQDFAPNLPKHYSAIPDRQDLDPDHWQKKSAMVGIKIDGPKIIAETRKIMQPVEAEFRAKFPLHPDGKSRFHLVNGTYMAGDAQYYYALVRALKPKRIVEIGSGASTILAEEAIKMNMAEDASAATSLTAIEPYPDARLDSCDKSIVKLVVSRLQKIDMSVFDALESGDILFIDSTHVLREGSDVQMEFLEILPRLKKGVYVHVHDISLPKPYPQVYFDSKLYWNEQYLLQAYLIGNNTIEVIWPGTYLMVYHEKEMFEIFPEIHDMRKKFPVSEPSGFWMKTV